MIHPSVPASPFESCVESQESWIPWFYRGYSDGREVWELLQAGSLCPSYAWRPSPALSPLSPCCGHPGRSTHKPYEEGEGGARGPVLREFGSIFSLTFWAFPS